MFLFFLLLFLSAVFLWTRTTTTAEPSPGEVFGELGCMKKDKGNRQGWKCMTDGKGARRGGGATLGFVIKQKQMGIASDDTISRIDYWLSSVFFLLKEGGFLFFLSLFLWVWRICCYGGDGPVGEREREGERRRALFLSRPWPFSRGEGRLLFPLKRLAYSFQAWVVMFLGMNNALLNL